MINYIVAAVLILIVGGAIRYIYKAKKSGQRCIGCPDGSSCSSRDSELHCSCDESHHGALSGKPRS